VTGALREARFVPATCVFKPKGPVPCLSSAIAAPRQPTFGCLASQHIQLGMMMMFFICSYRNNRNAHMQAWQCASTNKHVGCKEIGAHLAAILFILLPASPHGDLPCVTSLPPRQTSCGVISIVDMSVLLCRILAASHSAVTRSTAALL
jgi:hypothetical protein